MTVRSARVASARTAFIGERGVLLTVANGEGVGVSLMPVPRVASLIRAFDGVSDIAFSRLIEEQESDG
jgi:hypothetical protein